MNIRAELTTQFINRTNEQMFYLAGVLVDPHLFGDAMIEYKDLPETERRQRARIACIWKGYETLKGVQMFDN